MTKPNAFEPDQKSKDFLNKIVSDFKSGNRIPGNEKDDLDNVVSPLKRVSARIEHVPTEQKVSASMSFLIAGLCAASAFHQISNAFAKDADGERHIQPTQFGVGLVSALLAVGSAYIGAQGFRSGYAR